MWYEIDFNWYTIWIFKQVGLASHIHGARPPARAYANQS
jgi:fatty-acid desaturase